MLGKRFFLVVIIAGVLFSSCKKKINSCGELTTNCSDIQCLLFNSVFVFRITDKLTGEELLFGPTARYSITDIKLYTNSTQTFVVPLAIDSTNKKLICNVASEQMYLWVKNKMYTLQASYKSNGCCSRTVKDLSIDNKELCVCCNDVINLPVE